MRPNYTADLIGGAVGSFLGSAFFAEMNQPEPQIPSAEPCIDIWGKPMRGCQPPAISPQQYVPAPVAVAPVAPVPPAPVPENPVLTITSEPSGADIEINGESVGNTPTTITADKPDAQFITIVFRKGGFQRTTRSITVKAGDRKTVHADLKSDGGIKIQGLE